MTFESVSKLGWNMGVLWHYAELKQHESPSYQVKLLISKEGDFFVSEEGTGIFRIYYYFKNMFFSRFGGGRCGFVSKETAPQLPLVSRTIQCIETQYQAALDQVEEGYIPIKREIAHANRVLGQQCKVPYFKKVSAWFRSIYSRFESTQDYAKGIAAALPICFPNESEAIRAGERLKQKIQHVWNLGQVYTDQRVFANIF